MTLKIIKERIKEHFFLNPLAKLRVRQIEREVKVPLPSAIRYVKELTQEEILKKSTIAGVTFFTANRSSRQFLLEKKLFNITQLHNSGLIDFLIKELSNPTIIIFGSYSKGEDIEQSDIDLYIESSSTKKIKTTNFEIKLQRDLQLFRHKQINEIKNNDLTNNIINGIVLNGFLEVTL